jgi:hypothetical protein
MLMHVRAICSCTCVQYTQARAYHIAPGGDMRIAIFTHKNVLAAAAGTERAMTHG